MLRNLLVYRFIIFNTLMVVLIAGLALQGYVAEILEGDRSGIVYAILGLFLAAWGWTALRTMRASRALNELKAESPHPAYPEQRDKELAKIEWLGNVSDWLVGLGLLGTVIGFTIALSSVDQGSLAGAQGVQTSVETLMSGMRVALYTTLVGGVLGIWNEVNHRMLKTALGSYWADRLSVAGHQ